LPPQPDRNHGVGPALKIPVRGRPLTGSQNLLDHACPKTEQALQQSRFQESSELSLSLNKVTQDCICFLTDVLAFFSGNTLHLALQPRPKVDRKAQLRSFPVKLSPHAFGEIIFSFHIRFFLFT